MRYPVSVVSNSCAGASQLCSAWVVASHVLDYCDKCVLWFCICLLLDLVLLYF